MFASSKVRFFCLRSLYPFSDSGGEDADLIPRSMAISAVAVGREPVIPSFLGPAVTKDGFSLGFGFALHCGGGFVVGLGFFFLPQSISRQPSAC